MKKFNSVFTMFALTAIFWANFNVSMYTLEESPNDVTSMGNTPIEGVTIASSELPFGTKVRIWGHEYIVQDRMPGNNKLDIFVNDYNYAINFGRQTINCEVEIEE